jgi:hypothetical protein
MATDAGATIIMDKTRAEHYYRGRGFDGRLIRGRPLIRRYSSFIQIRETDLDMGDAAEFVIFPELRLRERPWRLWAKVAGLHADRVILQQLSGEQAGTMVTIPHRYFYDGRVLMGERLDDD